MEQLTKLLYLAFAVLGMGGGVAFAQQPQNEPPCPTSTLAEFGGLDAENHCDGTGCLVNFKKYQWWTAFNFNKKEGYYNGGLGTIFAPEHVVVDRQGDLRLRMAKDWDHNTKWAGAEAVLMFHADGTQANLGYGDYLVTAELVKPANATFATLDPNVALGMFTFERPKTASPNNPNSEMDLAEISRWGWNHVTPAACPFKGTVDFFNNMTLCEGDAQFALQLFSLHPKMVQRYDVGDTNKITLVMRWREGQVTFETYNGIHKLDNLPPTKEKEKWTTPRELKHFIPTPGCARFHINLWLGNQYDTNWNRLPEFSGHPGPKDGKEVEVVIRNFEFQRP